MEELRSTEILDREIQEDARRKAERILKACEEECSRIHDDVAVRIEQAQKKKKSEYDARLVSYKCDIESTIPLEKQRRLVSFIDSAVQESLDRWFREIGEDRRLHIISELLESYRSILNGKKIQVYYAGYPIAKVTKLVSRIFGKDTIVSISESKAGFAVFSDGIYIESDDKSIVCRATIDEIRRNLLAAKRQELAEALMGGRLPE